MTRAEQQFATTSRWLKALNVAQMLVHVGVVLWCYQSSPKIAPAFIVALAPWVFGNVITALAGLASAQSSLLLVAFALTQANGPIFLIVMTGGTASELGWMLPVFFLLMSATWGVFLGVLFQHVRVMSDPFSRRHSEDPTWSDIVRDRKSSTGQSMAELSDGRKLFVLLVRHQGCTFCREALDELRGSRAELEANGFSLCVVHMSSEAVGNAMLDRYGLADVPHFSDPQCEIYRAFEIQRGSFRQLMAPKVLWEGFKVAILRGFGFGRIVGDAFQMGGTFVLQNSEIVAAFRPKLASDRPDFCEIAKL